MLTFCNECYSLYCCSSRTNVHVDGIFFSPRINRARVSKEKKNRNTKKTKFLKLSTMGNGSGFTLEKTNVFMFSIDIIFRNWYCEQWC